jgi:hypothetical protein
VVDRYGRCRGDVARGWDGRVLEAAVGDAVDALEAELLDWLAKTW